MLALLNRALLNVMPSVAAFVARLHTNPVVLASGIRWRGQTKLYLQSLKPEVIAKARNIVVVRLDRLCDSVMFCPYLKDLRHVSPKAKITLISSRAAKHVYESCPFVDEVIVFDSSPVWQPRGPSTWQTHETLCLNAYTFAKKYLLPSKIDILLAPRFDMDG